MSDSTALVPLEVDRGQLEVKPDEQQLTPTQRALVVQITKTFDPAKDPTAITQFGIVAANGIAKLADPVLALVRSKNAPQAAAILENASKDARNLDFSRVKEAERGLALPNGIKKLAAAIDRLKKQVETLDKKMKQVEAKLEADKNLLTTRANTLFGLLQQSMDMYGQMRAYVYAADVKLAQLQQLKAAAVAAVDTAPDKALAQQEVTRLQGITTRLQARQMALKQMGVIAVQQVFSIQAVLNNAVGLLDTVEINRAAVATVWKTQVVVALSAYEQHQIAMQQQNFAANLGVLLNQTADQIGMAIEATANAQSTGIVTIDALESAGLKMVENITAYFEAQRRVEQATKDNGARIDKVKSDLVAAVRDATGDAKGIS